MAPTLGGGYEECPPSLLDFAARDRRWCQGNLQHLAVLSSRGFHWVSRLHLLTGIESYLTAPLWLVFLMQGILISLQAQFVRPEYFPKGFSLFPKWPAQDPILAAWVFGTMAMPIVPKLLAYILLLTHRKQQLRSHMHQQRRWQSDHLHSRHFAFREPRQLSSRHRTWPRRFGHFLGQRTAELIPQAGIL
jgi:membrane glycosyltransferase